jgi:hypothetical protein
MLNKVVLPLYKHYFRRNMLNLVTNVVQFFFGSFLAKGKQFFCVLMDNPYHPRRLPLYLLLLLRPYDLYIPHEKGLNCLAEDAGLRTAGC